MAAMATAIAAVGGTDNNQPRGAAEEMTGAATVMVAEIRMATGMARVLATIMLPTPTAAHQFQHPLKNQKCLIDI